MFTFLKGRRENKNVWSEFQQADAEFNLLSIRNIFPTKISRVTL
jgi:hypothetical protein